MTTALPTTHPDERTEPPADRRVEIHEDIRRIPAAEWDGLVPPGDGLARHRFVALCQESGVEEARYTHVVVRRGGRPVAVAPLFRMEVSLDLLSGSGLRRVARWGRTVRPGFLRVPVLFCGTPVSLGQSHLRAADGVDRREIAGEVAAVMEEIAEREGIDLLCIKELADSEANEWRGFEEHGFRRFPSLPYAVLDLRWESLAEYAADLRSGYRRQLRATLALRDEGFDVRRVADPAAFMGETYRLYGNVIERAEHRLETLGERFFGLVAERYAGELDLLAVERAGRPVATALVLRDGDAYRFLLAGLDYERGGARAYPLLLVEVLWEAILRGAETLHLGQTSEALKTRLGARLEPRHLLVRHRGGMGRRVIDAAGPWLFPEPPASSRQVFRR